MYLRSWVEESEKWIAAVFKLKNNNKSCLPIQWLKSFIGGRGPSKAFLWVRILAAPTSLQRGWLPFLDSISYTCIWPDFLCHSVWDVELSLTIWIIRCYSIDDLGRKPMAHSKGITAWDLKKGLFLKTWAQLRERHMGCQTAPRARNRAGCVITTSWPDGQEREQLPTPEESLTVGEGCLTETAEKSNGC